MEESVSRPSASPSSASSWRPSFSWPTIASLWGGAIALRLPSHQLFPPYGEGTPSSIDNSFIQLIPAYKYGKVDGKSGEGENICSVCLCEFKEGEDVRRLPGCLHSFHAPCIDMWLYSHTNCPLCRAEMTPSPLLPLRRSPPPGAGGLPRIGGGWSWSQVVLW